MKSKFIWSSITVVSAVALGTVLSLRPWQVYKEQRTIADEAVVTMRQAEAKKADLMQKRASYESASGREKLARQQGFMRPDETPLNVQ